MSSIFRKVLVFERLPSESGIFLTNHGPVHFLIGCKRWMSCEPQFWLEEIELPGEDFEAALRARKEVQAIPSVTAEMFEKGFEIIKELKSETP